MPPFVWLERLGEAHDGLAQEGSGERFRPGCSAAGLGCRYVPATPSVTRPDAALQSLYSASYWVSGRRGAGKVSARRLSLPRRPRLLVGTCRSTRREGTAATCHFSLFRVLDTSPMASGPIYMNERNQEAREPLRTSASGSEQVRSAGPVHLSALRSLESDSIVDHYLSERRKSEGDVGAVYFSSSAGRPPGSQPSAS